MLVVTAAAGKVLAQEDDSGGGLAARLLFTAPADGSYRLGVTSYEQEGCGTFTLTVRVWPHRK